MSIMQDDILRELELLPMWKLRPNQRIIAGEGACATNPAPPPNTQPAPQIVAPTLSPTENVATEVVAQAPSPTSAVEIAPANIDARMLQVGDLLLIFAPLQTQDEKTLLQNMVNALQADPRVDIGLQSNLALGAHATKVMIAMGKVAAQALGLFDNALAANQLLTDSGIQQTAFGAAIVTYSPAYLLKNPHNKAQAWQHLCTAKLHAQAV